MRRILLDTDLAMGAPGSSIDDGFALVLALTDPGLSLELVTTVAGNTDVDSATRLTVDLLRRLGHPDVPVVRGAEHPLRGRTSPAGSDATPRPLRSAAPGTLPGYAAVHLVEKVTTEPGAFTIVAIGPLTNVALAMLLEPTFAQCVEDIVVMGGVFLHTRGRVRMPAEFNTYCDPEATAVVLASGAPVRFVGLDVTQQVRLRREHTDQMRSLGSDFACFAADCADAWMTELEQSASGTERHSGSCALHDPLTVACLSHPDLLTWRPAHLAVETCSALTRGMTVADLLNDADSPSPNCHIAVDVDSQAFVQLFLDRMSRV